MIRANSIRYYFIVLLAVITVVTAKAQSVDPPTPTPEPQSKIKILGNVYGGGDQAAIQGNTNVTISKGQYGGEIFGGGKGALYTAENADAEHAVGTVKSSADIGTLDGEGNLVDQTGTTNVTINGGKFIVEQETTGKEAGKLTNNHNVFGGGNLACNVFGSTKVNINAGLLPESFFAVDNTDPANPTSMYRRWGEYVGRIEGMTTAKVPDTPEKLVQGSVFGAGYGVHTDVAGTTNVTIAIGDEEAINAPADILTRYGYAKRGGDLSGEHLASKFVITAFGGGYDGTAENTNVQISGSPFLQNVFGGGLGSKAGAEQKDPETAYASTVGTVKGGTNVNISGATIYGNVYGGGAGIFGEIAVNMPGRGEANMPYYKAAMVMKETNLEISGGTLIFGNVYGGGDIANTGWFEENYRPSTAHQAYENESKAKFDLTTYLQMKGGNVMGNVFAGGNGRKMTELEKANFIGAIIGNTSVVLGNYNSGTSVWDAGTKIWGSVYGGGQNGCVYSCAAMAANNGGTARTLASGLIDGCTNVEFKHTDIGQDIFGGGLGAVEMVDHDHDPATPEQEVITSADISGNTFVFYNRGNLITGNYWDPQDCVFKAQNCGERFRDTESDIAHNLYGGGNVACTIGTKDRGTNKLATGTGNTTVYMIGAPVVDDSFVGSTYYQDAMKIYGKPHFSAFGAGYGKYAKVLGNAYSDIALVAAGFHSVVGGGMNGPVEGECYTHIACDKDNTRIHNVYGGGYYAPVGGTHLQITEGHILENVFGGGVMGNIAPTNAEMTKSVTSTIIGLKNDGSDLSSYIVKGTDGTTPVREYTFASHQNKIIIEGNVYGGNDVSGTVNGIAELSIYGGEMKHDVYGAGNGDHDGYYEPGYGVYDRGDWGTDNYYYVDHSADVSTDGLDIHGPQGNTYIGRPQTVGGVKLTLAGNSTSDRVKVLGQVFGGGNSCTIGAWDKSLLTGKYSGNPHEVRDDPDYFVGGGKLSVTLGSHIRIGRTHGELDAASSQDKADYLQNVFINGQNIPENVSGLYMGCSGRHLATQTTDVDDHNYHHYYDRVTARYWPGFIVYKNEDGHTNEPVGRAAGLATFRAYLNNILIKTDDVSLNIANDADDIWISNFVGGGFRGSMKAFSDKGQFHYTLPRGVTIGHDIIGGAFNTDVVYHIFKTTDGHNYPTVTDVDGKEHYQYLTEVGTMKSMDEVADINNADYHHLEKDPITGDVTGIVRFYYNGGMLSELAYEKDPSENDRINRILKKYSAANDLPVERDVNKDFTGTGLTDNKAFNYYKRDALVYLELDNQLEVEYVDGKVHGGNVFGGCFSSGRVEGDIWTDYRCFQESQQANSEDFNLSDRSFNNAKDFENNFAMMLFGAGYGANTNIQGSAYVRVLHPEKNPSAPIPGMAYGYPRLYNVFGGSYEGKVEGNTNIYFNPGKYGYVTGAIYGGGCNGYVGGKTYLELAGGYIDEAYGGARNANIGGGTHIWAYDGSARWWGEDVIHSNGDPMVEADAEKAPLFIGKLYGGTDISGQICTDEAGNYDSDNGYQPYYSASYWPKELTTTGTYDPAHPGDNLTYIDTYLQVGGITQSNSGFPIIGAVYAAGNGEETESFFNTKYSQTNKNEDKYNDAKLPTQHTTLMEVSDGNIVYAFGGGNHATVEDQNYILVRAPLDGKHKIEDLGSQMFDVMKKRVLNVGIDCYDEVIGEDVKTLDLKNASIQRLFGGNNIATMAIQPKWSLQKGRINNVYSGGNMGDMTYYNPDGVPSTEDGTTTGKSGSIAADGSNSNYNPRGLSITIEHPDIHIVSLFGGCRLSNVIPGGYNTDGKTPLKKTDFESCEDYYGATVNITDGYIENVYGGNDISGTVFFGTNVNISGAVSGNVYGSGNGFYLYKWDTTDTQITEHLLKEYDSSLSADDKTLCYTVPASAVHNGESANNTDKMLTINDARPSVEKAFLNIAGLEHYPMGNNSNPKRVAYVKGNVYCGGNASTILGNESFSKFKIGSYVTLNGVFMGSDGYAFTQQDEIARFAKVNNFTDMGEATDPSAFPDWNGSSSVDASHNPILLNVYMMAVDMNAQPKDFNLNLPLKEAHIGTYCGGGNRGSMLVDKTVTLPFHHDIIIYDKIVAACLDANVKYTQDGETITSWGGYTRKVDVDNNGGRGNTKFDITIASQFAPLVMDVPANKLDGTTNSHGETFTQAQSHDFLYARMDKKDVANVFNSSSRYEVGCNIYGGCYNSGEVEGDVNLTIHTNMLRYANKEKYEQSVADNIACFNVYGAGYGLDSHVWGNVKILMNKSTDDEIMGTNDITLNDQIINQLGTSSAWDIQNADATNTLKGDFGAITNVAGYPAVGSIFGGGRSGMLIGNAEIQIRNGLVFRDVTGGSYAADMYGSSQVIVGYPKYYKCNKSAVYSLERGDKWNSDKQLDNTGNNPVLKQNVHYMRGDLVPANVWNQIHDKDATLATSNFTPVTDDLPNSPTWNTTWDDIKIKIGGGVYGGGFSLTNSMSALAGSISTHKLSATDKIDNYFYNNQHQYMNFDDRYGMDITSTAGYGGNSSVMIGDNTNLINEGKTIVGIKDHIRISTLQAEVAKFNDADWVDASASEADKKDTENHNSVIGKFLKSTSDGKDIYTHLGDGRPIIGNTYYTLSGEGGIYGDGHLVFCEGFRAADITGYGYAEGSPKHPVLLNTFQRLDLVSMNDCCLMLQGAQDFATNQTDATIYSIARIDELRMNSSLDATQRLLPLSNPDGTQDLDFDTKQVRNYLGFFNNIHFLGSLITNDPFVQYGGAIFHSMDGKIEAEKTYYQKKQDFIDAYANVVNNSTSTDTQKNEAALTFKQRNVGTARNAIGINNGYCLRIQNQCFHEGEAAAGSTYYGPIVGVCEVKLLTLVEGEGGGYVYADNVHKDKVVPNEGDDKNGHDFLNVSGNFVFPGIVKSGDGSQYIVDDCFPIHYGSTNNLVTPGNDTKAEAHYWFVEGNKYFFHTTLTGYTFTAHQNFDLINNDANILLSGLANGYKLQVKSVNWGASVHSDGYVDDLVAKYDDTGRNSGDLVQALTPADGYTKDKEPYEFNMQVGRYYGTDGHLNTVWNENMSRKTVKYPDDTEAKGYNISSDLDVMPLFNVTLSDNVDNAPKYHEEEYYNAHLREPDVVKIVLFAKAPDGAGTPDFTYTITMNIVYMQGPSFTGGPVIENCILPGEILKFSSEGVHVHTTDQLPLTKFGWKIVKPVVGYDPNDIRWQTDEIAGSTNNPIDLDPSLYDLVGEHLEGHMPGYYYQNGWNIAYIFTAGGHDFAVLPVQDTDVDASQRMFVIHNYHRMYKEDDLKVPMAADARVYIEEEKDMKAFLDALTDKPASGSDPAIPPYNFEKQRVFLMKDFDLTTSEYSTYNLDVLKNFNGTFDGFGHSLTVPSLGDITATTSVEHNDKSILTLFREDLELTGIPYVEKYTDQECIDYNKANRIKDGAGRQPDTDGYELTYPAGFTPRTTNDEKVRIGAVVNLLVLDGSDDESSDDYKYGKMAYDLNKFYLDRREDSFDTDDSYTRKYNYVEDYFKNGDYQYAGIQAAGKPFLRTGENNYGSDDTHHDTRHTHDKRRWNGDHNVPLYEVDYATNDTYDANNLGDFNDYIYFGQKIVKGSRGSYELDEQRPHAIKKNEAPALYQEASLNNMNDRVFLAEGYYHTKENKGFYHNVDAVVIDPYTTAVGFGEESMTIDQPEKGITKFDVDSNKDYDANGDANVDTSGNLMDEDKYSNAVTGHVTQNLLVYTNKADNSTGLFADGNYANNSKESDVRYHAIDLNASSQSIANFHLVDKQDFNAPIAFDVTTRAWYERMPDRWRNAGDYSNATAWEGICLPFTAKKVTASENGEISHFYGKIPASGVNDRTLHHEYWLTGFAGSTTTNGNTTATFYRPSKEASTSADTDENKQVFCDARQETDSYSYPANSYFTSLTDYTNFHDDLADNDPWKRTDPEWYLSNHSFADYVYLSKTMPYIIAFPGNDFYEFSMEGTGYNVHTHKKDDTKPQLVTFETPTATIAVSDDEDGERTSTVNGYNHVGTYMLKNATATQAPSQLGNGIAMNAGGTKFEDKVTGREDTFDYVLPFRTYMLAPSTTSPAPASRSIIINGAGDDVERDIEIDLEDDEDNAIPALSIRIKGLQVYVTSTFEDMRRVNVYSLKGQLLRVHDAPTGISEFRLPTPGLYIINGVKVTVRQ